VVGDGFHPEEEDRRSDDDNPRPVAELGDEDDHEHQGGSERAGAVDEALAV
jgi:hypothetical protein